jgi:DNA-binding transcriptional MerR regulator
MMNMTLKDAYTIGEAAKKCYISKKTLRFYDEQGILRPDKVGENHYRYYSLETLLTIPVLKYYKQMGFTLSEIRNFADGGSLNKTRKLFADKVNELEIEKNHWEEKYTSAVDWLELIEEAQTVLENQVTEVSVKFREKETYIYLDQAYNNVPMDAIINIEFTNFIEDMHNAITGPVIIQYPSWEKRMNDTCKTMRIVQKTILTQGAQTMELGGGLFLSSYHIGGHEDISTTYERMTDWANSHGYKCNDVCYERYVVDYWTTKNKSDFVTEVLIEVSR